MRRLALLPILLSLSVATGVATGVFDSSKSVSAATSAPALVSPAPTGPAVPASGWSVAYADGFGAPLGSAAGQDNTWTLKASGNFTNGREQQTFSASEDYVTTAGLVERCTKATKTCGAVESKFRLALAEGAEFAFEDVTRYPPNQQNEDFGKWAYGYGGGKESEFDFTESWGYNSENTLTSGYTRTRNGTCWLPTETGEDKCASGIYSFDPAAAFHRYTTVIYPDNTFSQYIDGALTPWANHVSIKETPNKPLMRLIFSYAMAGSGFTETTSTAGVRSVAVYEDKAHAGQHIENGGIAPGTTIGSSEPEPPPPPTTETTPPPPPPPPAAEVPAAPSGCTAATHREGTTSWLGVSCAPSSGATSYTLWRTEATAKSSTAKPGEAWTSGSTPAFTNHVGVKQGERYCFREAAANAAGQSSPSADFCATA